MERAIMFNQQEMPPMQLLSDAEVLKVVASAWTHEIEGRNWIGRGARIALGHHIVDDLAAAAPHAFALFSVLQRYHGGDAEPFVIAKSMAETLRWTLRTFKAARDELVRRGLLVCVHPGGLGPHDPPLFTFGQVALGGEAE